MNILPSIVIRRSRLRSDGGRIIQNTPEPHSLKRNAMEEAQSHSEKCEAVFG